jgi:iron complex outermembrane recepter protein
MATVMRSTSRIHLLAAALSLARALEGQTVAEDLSIEEILRTQITSVGRKAQQVAKAPAAVYVITQEDIRRSGATQLPDVLRMVPGLGVARINGSSWAISSRGDAWQYSNKMLVLVDGRSVYSRLFSGVYWNVQDVILEDVDRIEVIRGPGAVMWGSNAVNGVISIITKKSQATRGGLLTLGAGTDDQAIVGFRYGGQRGDRLAYRVWGKFNAREFRNAGTPIYRPNENYSGTERGLTREIGSMADTARLWRSGFRLDWEKSSRDTLTVLGEIYGQRYQQRSWLIAPGGRLQLDASVDRPTGGNVLARWTRTTSSNQDTTVQFWADRNTQSSSLYSVVISTADAEVQHRRLLSDRNELHLGGGFRLLSDSIRSVPLRFMRPSRTDGLWNGVIRDEHQFIPNKLILSAGIRTEHNAYTGFEYQPSIRLLFTPAKAVAWWASWSRAVRTPSRAERDLQILPLGVASFQQLPVLLQVLGNQAFVSERVHAAEAGFRWQHRQRWSLDLALFHNRYTRLSSLEPGQLNIQWQPVPDIRQDLVFSNGRQGTSRGGEIALSGNLRPWWRLLGSYSYLSTVSDRAPNFNGIDGRLTKMDPHHQAKLQSHWNLSQRWQADVSLYAVGRVAQRSIPGYLRADTRLSWRPSRIQEWSFITQDLFNNGRLEWQPELFIYAIPTRRAVLLRWTFQF